MSVSRNSKGQSEHEPANDEESVQGGSNHFRFSRVLPRPFRTPGTNSETPAVRSSVAVTLITLLVVTSSATGLAPLQLGPTPHGVPAKEPVVNGDRGFPHALDGTAPVVDTPRAGGLDSQRMTSVGPVLAERSDQQAARSRTLDSLFRVLERLVSTWPELIEHAVIAIVALALGVVFGRKLHDGEVDPHRTHSIDRRPEDRFVRELLEEHGGTMKQSEIVKATGWSKAKVSRTLTRMEAIGVVTKQQVGRQNEISLTPNVRSPRF